jgi:hypothetical protein
MRRLLIVPLLLALGGLPVPDARAEPFLDLFTGKSFTLDADVDVEQKSLGNDFTFRDVSFDDESFEDPPWYGARAGYFFENSPWGVALEFFHFKVISATQDTLRLQGTVGGLPVDTRTRMDSIVQQFQVTHGVNYLTLDVLARQPLLVDPEAFPHGRIQLYGGAGLGPVIAHPENRINFETNDEDYELAGVGVHGFVGARAMLWKYLGLFAEYKFSYSSLDVDVAHGDGSVDEATHHLIGGITIAFPSF